MIEETVTCDVLCAGGGIAGLMAAIRASEQGAKVVVAEKGNVKYSGCERSGNDHFETYIPQVHGGDMDGFIDELLRTAKGEILLGKDIFRAQFSRAFEMVQQARDRGVRMLNRVMVVELLRNSHGIIGAVGIHTREDKVLVFKAKAVILGTGKCSRLYPSLTPGWMFNDPHGGGLTGDGRAMAFRAGAELQNVEMPQRHIGPKYFTKFGQATWVGVLIDAEGKPVGTFVDKPDRKYGDMIMEVNKQAAQEYTQAGCRIGA